MNDAQEFVKKYWPYIVGGIIALWLLSRSSGSSGGAGDFYAAQAAASVRQQELAAQQAQLQAQINAQAAQTEMQREALQAQANIGYLDAQAKMAAAVGESATGVVNALYAPGIAAMNSAAYENAATAQAAATIAGTGFASQAAIAQAVAGTAQAGADALQVWGPVSQGVAQVQSQPGFLDNLLGAGTILGSQAIARGRGYPGYWGR